MMSCTPLHDAEAIRRMIADFVENAPEIKVRPEAALRPELAGMRMYDPPLVGFAAAGDPFFEDMLRPEIIGDHFVTPSGWLPGAKSVVSWFLPFSDAVIDSNRVDPVFPSDEWLHARVEGQAAMNALGAAVVRAIENAGFQAVCPSSDGRFWSRTAPAGVDGRGVHVPGFTSNWSERHAAHACGLGTFGMSLSLITAKGSAGRFGSVVTTLPLEPSGRPYAKHDAYCIQCGMCAKRCFAGAIDPEKGKNKGICAKVMEERVKQYAPRYGCGKCNVNVPCERKNPTA